VNFFVEKYDTVTAPSGEGQTVRKEMTVQVEQWWNSSDVVSSLREENAWDPDDTVTVVGKRKKCVPDGGSPVPTETVDHDEQTLLLDDWTHVEEETVKYSLRRVKCPHRLVTCPVKCVGSFISTAELLSLN
jgi:hypothetical protein